MVGGGATIWFMPKIQFGHSYNDIISVENLLAAWQEFVRGKRSKTDVQKFELRLMGNILALHKDLVLKQYKHGGYQAFNISDPKPRNIHKTTVRDRLLHHAIYRLLYPFFDRIFIADSFSCRLNKGTHKSLNRFREFAYQVSHNHTRTCWVLKCDIRKFFASIDHEVLKSILADYITDDDIVRLLYIVVDSFSIIQGKGVPLGNLTSQLFCNIYLNEFDQLVKHRIKARYYLRYADDFVILSPDKTWLVSVLPEIKDYLSERLKLTLHPYKIILKTLASGVDWLGWVHFPNHRVLRTVTKRRMLKRLKEYPTEESKQSYLGLLKHGCTHHLSQIIINSCQ